MVRVSRRLERILIGSKLITQEQLDAALNAKNDKGLTRTIAELGFSSETKIAKAVADYMKLEFVDLDNYEIDPNAVTLIDEETSGKYDLIPIGFNDERLIVAMVDPANIFAIDDLRLLTKREIVPVVATESDIIAAINRFSRMDESVEEIAENVAGDLDGGPSSENSDEDDSEEAPVVKLVNLILLEAVRDRASDIFIEPQDRDVRVRYRIDGVLHEIMRSPKKIQAGLTSRLKIMSGMDIAERRVPQDGRFNLNHSGKAVDFRVATLPTIYGEDIVLRLLMKDSLQVDLDDMGFLPQPLKRFKASFTKPYGAILITGPTGSGKTTTLYGALRLLNQVEKNLITVEDPVEYRLAGINQVQVNERAKMTFGAALRSILRHDPDIVMIGEIRDEETALIAIESALTGHLVLSTLHTNDAASSLTRLIEMGVEPFLISSAVDCVVAQRLARRLCVDCREQFVPTEQMLIDAGLEFTGDIPKLYRAKGCKKCNDTGYHGRVGLYEVLVVSETIEKLTVNRVTSDKIKEVAIEEGMLTLRQDGLKKVLKGLTSIEEIARVTA